MEGRYVQFDMVVDIPYRLPIYSICLLFCAWMRRARARVCVRTRV